MLQLNTVLACTQQEQTFRNSHATRCVTGNIYQVACFLVLELSNPALLLNTAIGFIKGADDPSYLRREDADRACGTGAALPAGHRGLGAEEAGGGQRGGGHVDNLWVIG